MMQLSRQIQRGSELPGAAPILLFRTPTRTEEISRPLQSLVTGPSSSIDVTLANAPFPSPPIITMKGGRIEKESIPLVEDYIKSVLNGRMVFQAFQSVIIAELSKRIGRQLYVKGSNALSMLLSYARNTLKIPDIDPDMSFIKSDWDTGLNQPEDLDVGDTYTKFHNTVSQAISFTDIQNAINAEIATVIQHVKQTLKIDLTLMDVPKVAVPGKEDWNKNHLYQVNPVAKGMYTSANDCINAFTLLRFMMRFEVNGTGQYITGELIDLSFSRKNNLETGALLPEYEDKHQLMSLNVSYIRFNKPQILILQCLSFSDMLEDLWQMSYIEPRTAQETGQVIHPKAEKRQKRLIDFLQKIICTHTDVISLSPSASMLLYPKQPFDLGPCGPLTFAMAENKQVQVSPLSPDKYNEFINSCPDAFIDYQFEKIHKAVMRNLETTPRSTQATYPTNRQSLENCLKTKKDQGERKIACAIALLYYKFTVSWYSSIGMWDALALYIFYNFNFIRNSIITNVVRNTYTIAQIPTIIESTMRPIVERMVSAFQVANYKVFSPKVADAPNVFVKIIQEIIKLAANLNRAVPNKFLVTAFGGTAFQIVLTNTFPTIPVMTADIDINIVIREKLTDAETSIGFRLVNECYTAIVTGLSPSVPIIESQWANDTIGGKTRYTRQVEYMPAVNYETQFVIVSRQHLVEFIVTEGTPNPTEYTQLPPGNPLYIQSPEYLKKRFIYAIEVNRMFDITKSRVYERRMKVLDYIVAGKLLPQEQIVAMLDPQTTMTAKGRGRRTFRKKRKTNRTHKTKKRTI